MRVKIVMSGPGGELDSIILGGIEGETDDRISEHVRDMADTTTWAVGDTLTITEID